MRSIGMRGIGSVVAGCVVVLAASAAVMAQGKGKLLAWRPRGATTAPARASGEGVAVQVTVLEAKIPRDKVALVDMGALTAEAATVSGLQAALAKVGPTRVLYRAYQPSTLSGTCRIQLGSRRPFVMASRATSSAGRTMLRSRPVPDGPKTAGTTARPDAVRVTGSPRSASGRRPAGVSRINTVQYEDVGMVLELALGSSGKGAKAPIAAHMELELSVPADSGVEITKGIAAKEVRQVRVDYVAAMRVGRASVTVLIDGSGAGKDAPATAYVCRVLLSEMP